MDTIYAHVALKEPMHSGEIKNTLSQFVKFSDFGFNSLETTEGMQISLHGIDLNQTVKLIDENPVHTSIEADTLRMGFVNEGGYPSFRVELQLNNPGPVLHEFSECIKAYIQNNTNVVDAIVEIERLQIPLFRTHYRRNKRTPNAAGLYWLQYWGKREFLRQGGEAIFDNPYIKAEKIGEGVLIQVGDDPWQAHTPDGEALLVKATQALPPVIVDWGPGKKPLA